jgi:cholera toxin transcriptional activator
MFLTAQSLRRLQLRTNHHPHRRTGAEPHSAKLAFKETAMTAPGPSRRYRFGVFEVDAHTGELRRQGVRIKLNAQPFQVLLLLLARPGELLTREEISRELWPDGTFVDYEHGVNSAVNRIREALSDTAAAPRFIETLARRGYRFIAPVESIPANGAPTQESPTNEVPAGETSSATNLPERLEPDSSTASTSLPESDATRTTAAKSRGRILATPEDLPRTPHAVVQTLFILLQLMYLAFYIGALTNLAEIQDLLSPLARAALLFMTLIVSAAILIPVRAFVLCAVLFRAPAIREKFLRLWPFLLLFDVLWSLSPFLLLHHINFGLALACMALLVYSPFAQRSLILMGAGRAARALSATAR